MSIIRVSELDNTTGLTSGSLILTSYGDSNPRISKNITVEDMLSSIPFGRLYQPMVPMAGRVVTLGLQKNAGNIDALYLGNSGLTIGGVTINNNFGLHIDDSVNITGSLYVSGSSTFGGNLVPATPRGATLGTLENPFRDIYIQSASINIQSDTPGAPNTTLSNVAGNLLVSAGGMQLVGSASFIAQTGSFQYLSGSFKNVGIFTQEGATVITGALAISGTTTQIGDNNLLGNTVLSGSITVSGSQDMIGTSHFVGSQQLTGSLTVSGSTVQIGNNTLQGNTKLSGSIEINGTAHHTGSMNILGDTYHIGQTNHTGSVTITGSLYMTGSGGVGFINSHRILTDLDTGSFQANWMASSGSSQILNVNGTNGPTTIAIGRNTGLFTRPTYGVAIGNNAGESSQGEYGVAIGNGAGQLFQGTNAVAIGSAGYEDQGQYAIAIGSGAGDSGQGAYAIAIGAGAGANHQTANSIILDATNGTIQQAAGAGLHIAPIRSGSTTSNVLNYNTTTKEITYITSSFETTGRGIISGSAQLTSSFDGRYTTTGSNIFISGQTITGSLNITGSIYVSGSIVMDGTAQTYFSHTVTNPSNFVLHQFLTSSYHGGTYAFSAHEDSTGKVTVYSNYIVAQGAGSISSNIGGDSKVSSGAGAPNPAFAIAFSGSYAQFKVTDTGTFTYKGIVQLY